jgi:hypothetical protein
MLRAQTRHLHGARLGAMVSLLPTPAVPCAAEYAWGEDGSNQCPTSYYAIDTAAACETAATAAGKAYFRSETDPSSPSGCYLHQRYGGFYFNADAVGAGVRGTQLLCSGAANLAQPAQAPRGTIGYSRGTIGHPPGYSRRAAAVLPCGPSRTAGLSTIGYSRGTRGGTMGHSRGTVGSSRGTIGAHKYRAAGRKEALDAAHALDARGLCGWARGAAATGALGTPLSGRVLMGYRRRAPLRACMVDRTSLMRRSLCVGDLQNAYVLPTRTQAASPCLRMRLQPSRPPERQRQQRRRSASMVLRHHSTVGVAVHVCAQQ